MLATFADYSTIRPGDYIFFFRQRLIYGIAKAADPLGTGAAVFLNYPEADRPSPPEAVPDAALVGPGMDSNWRHVRVVIPFVAAPRIFPIGIDMDEVLGTRGSDVAWGLRFWDGFSFQQLTELETELLLRVFFMRFGDEMEATASNPGPSESDLITRFSSLNPTPFSCLALVRRDPGSYVDGHILRSEELLHGLLAEEMYRSGSPLGHRFRGDVYHELSASPPKPPRWADHIDVVGTRVADLGPDRPYHFDIVEAKRERLTGAAGAYEQTISQLMKYVDFVCSNHAGGNYAALSAAFIAAGYSEAIIQRHRKAVRDVEGVVSRSYVLNPREATPTRIWSDVRLLEYRWDSAVETLVLSEPE